MNSSSARRALVVVAFALCLGLGMVLTPPPADDPGTLLSVLTEHSARARATAVFRLLTSLLTVPMLLALAPTVHDRASRLFGAAAALLHVAAIAAVAVVTQVVVQAEILARLSDRATAVRLAGDIDESIFGAVAGVTYLLGMLLGFLLLGLHLWRSGHSRILAASISLGLVLHIAGGDWPVTTLAGAAVLAGGLSGVGLTVGRGGPSGPRSTRDADPLAHLVSDELR